MTSVPGIASPRPVPIKDRASTLFLEKGRFDVLDGAFVGWETRARLVLFEKGYLGMTDIPEITDEQLDKAIPARLRQRLRQGRFESGEDIAMLRRFVGLTQTDFAKSVEISVHNSSELGTRKKKARRPRTCALEDCGTAPKNLGRAPEFRSLIARRPTI